MFCMTDRKPERYQILCIDPYLQTWCTRADNCFEGMCLLK